MDGFPRIHLFDLKYKSACEKDTKQNNMTNTWLNKLGRLCLSLVVLDYVSVAIAEEAAALAFGGGGGSSSSAAGGLFHHVGKRMELQSCISECIKL